MTVALIPHLVMAFAITAGLVLVLRGPAERLDLVDRPGGRKRHARPTPLIGGLAMTAGFLVAVATIDAALRPYAALFTGMGLLLSCGVLDDLRDLGSTAKFVVQLIVATLVVAWGGLVVTHVGSIGPWGAVGLGSWAVPLTLFGIVGLINAVNMLDGVDGLAGGAAAAMLVWLAVAAVFNGLAETAVVIAVLAAAVGGFLLFNVRHPWRSVASAFLGDSGSLVLGLAIAWFCIEIATAGPDAPVSPVALAWVVALPVMDTVSLMLRRLIKGQSPFVADREHLHHLFLRAGYSVGQTTALLVGIAFALGGLGVVLSAYGVPDPLLALGLLVAIGLHFTFIRYAWRTMKALRRLGQRRDGEAGLALAPNRTVECLGSPVRGWRRGLALGGLYLTIAAIPLSTALTNIGMAIVAVATILSAPLFLRDMVRLPLFWLTLALTSYVGLAALLGAWQSPDLAAASEPHWRHVLRVTGLLSLPMAWWLAGARFHWPWLFWVLIAGSGTAFALDAHWSQLLQGGLGDSRHYGSPDEYASVAACVLVLMFATCVSAVGRFGRGWRPAFTLIISVVAAVPVLLLLVASDYITAWLGAGVGFLVVGACAGVYGLGRRQWAGLLGGSALVALLGFGSWLLIHEQVPAVAAFQEPVQAGALYLGGEPELARDTHAATAERLGIWSAALERLADRPVFGWGGVYPSAGATDAAAGPDGYMNFYLSLLVGYGLVGFSLFATVVYLLVHRLARATSNRLLPVGVATALYGALGAMGMMMLLSTQIDQTASRALIMVLFALCGAVGVMRLWQRDHLRACRHAPNDDARRFADVEGVVPFTERARAAAAGSAVEPDEPRQDASRPH